MRIRKLLVALTTLAGMAIAMPQAAQANVIINGTRLVYPAQNQEITIRTENPDSTPALVQAWIDEGDPGIRAEESLAPFVVTPPLIRLEGNSGQTFRVIFVPGETQLPQDKESLFYFNLLDIPPMPQEAEAASYMQFAYRTRLKLFYRPVDLPGNVSEAAAQLQWSFAQVNGKLTLQVHNPSAYHVSFNGIALDTDNRQYRIEGDMIAPGATSNLPIPGLSGQIPPSQAARVNFNWLNDFGALIQSSSPVKP